MFRHRKNVQFWAVPTPIVEKVPQHRVGADGTTYVDFVDTVIDSSTSKLPDYADYKLSVLQQSGVPLKPVSLDILDADSAVPELRKLEKILDSDLDSNNNNEPF